MAFLAINQTGQSDIVAAQAGKVIVVEGYQLVSSGANSIKFQSVTAGGVATDITGPMPVAANGQLYADSVQMGLCQTNSGEGLRLSGTAGVIGGHVRYSMRG